MESEILRMTDAVPMEASGVRGYVHLYCGDGKGKTTAAIGLAVRAAGHDRKVLISRFLKNDDSGEVAALKRIPQITVLPCRESFGFAFRMTEEERKRAAVYYTGQFRETIRMAADGSFDILILDEILAACQYELVAEAELLDFLGNRPASLEVVLTGRNPSEAVREQADYISEIRMERHPFSRGVTARKGIEY
ncbi:MAG: cob(I)yrinic acid a,c-diamide adenosyltransferase [Clostridiales bacterium]|nr:cob(I)yrinic acid a,c-diamide adenosyltransferase [Clostridiales bacterium]